MDPQPDFEIISSKCEIISSNFTDLSAQFSRCGNIPAMIGGDALITTLNRLTNAVMETNVRMTAVEGEIRDVKTRLGAVETRLTAVEGDMRDVKIRLGAVEKRVTGVEEGLAGFHDRLVSIENRIAAGEVNAVARLWNGLHSPDLPLRPLHCLHTNEPLLHFPQTKHELHDLPRPRVTECLHLLGQPTDGTEEEKLRLLKVASGCVNWGA